MADASLLGLVIRLAVSMGVVVGLMLLAARVLRRSAGKLPAGGRTAKVRRTPIAVETMQALTRGAHVAVVHAGGRELVIGITDQQVTLLHSSAQVEEDLGAIDALSQTATTSVDPDAARARIARTAGTDVPGGDLGTTLSAWTDALETLREKTVRR